MHVGARPAHDLPRTLSKLIAAGMPEADALAAVSVRPARVLGLADEIGKLAPGACADLTVLQRSPDGPPLTDAFGNQRKSCCLQTALTVRAGSIVERVPSGDD
jgi:dihydroorotase